ncbi:MAG: O-antigen ligase family protein [Nitrospirae bacterium]|nr:O-antigen ligase family protein [Nitrospirota bacterium]
MIITIALFCLVAYFRRIQTAKFVLLLTIALLGIFASYNFFAPPLLLILFACIVIAPVLMIISRRYLVDLMWIWLALVVFEYVGKINIPVLPDIEPQRLIWMMAFSTFLLEAGLKQRRINFSDITIEAAMLLFCLYVFFSMMVAGTLYSEKDGLMLKILLTGYAIPFSIFFLAKNLLDDESKIKKIFVFFAAMGFYLGFTAICEYYGINSLVFPSYITNLQLGIHQGRARGPFLNGALNGTALSMAFFYSMYLFFQSKNRKARVFLAVGMMLIATGVLLTLTRSCWVGFILSLLTVPVFFPQTRKAAVICVLASVILIYTQFSLKQIKTDTASLYMQHYETSKMISDRTFAIDPVYHRLTLYFAVGKMFLEKPIFGFGFNTFQDVSPKYIQETKIEGIPYYEGGSRAHDTWTSTLVELGLIGLGFTLFILIAILRIGKKLYDLLPDDGFLSKKFMIIYWAIFINYFANFQFIEMKLFYFPNAVFYMMSGIVVGVYQRKKAMVSETENHGMSREYDGWKTKRIYQS